MSYGYVYVVRNDVNGKKYIGQTTRSVEERWKEHLRKTITYDHPFSRALRKYNEEDFSLEVLCECSCQEELDTKEVYYIENLNTISPFGYNCTYGGVGGKLSKETVRKISSSLIGKTHSDETKRKMSVSRTGKRNGMYGKEMSESTKNKISESLKGRYTGEFHPMYGKKHSEEAIDKMSKEYVFVSPDGETVKLKNLYKFCKESRENLNPSHMVAVYKGKRNSHKGWTKYERVST